MGTTAVAIFFVFFAGLCGVVGRIGRWFNVFGIIWGVSISKSVFFPLAMMLPSLSLSEIL